jgi:hypothetical protein
MRLRDIKDRNSVAQRRRRGAAALELTIVLPFVAFLFLTAVDFCRVFHATQTVQGAAQTAAVYAAGVAQPPSNMTAVDAARQAAVADAAVLDPPRRPEDVSIDVSAGGAQVAVSYDFTTIVPYPGLPQTLHLVRAARVNIAPRAGDGN